MADLPDFIAAARAVLYGEIPSNPTPMKSGFEV
jgi:hypothetical protein